MDFKIGDEIEEVDENTEKKPKKISIIVIVVVSLVIGLTVFFVSNAIFGGPNKKKDTPAVSSAVSIEDDNVKILYDYVTYGIRGTRNDKFIKEQSVKLEDFSNYEKFYYALQFAQVEDFASTGQVNAAKQKVYNISSAKIKNYMQRFFGSKVNFSTSSVITYPFSFRINNLNVGTLTYAVERDGYDTVFTKLEENITSNALVEPYYTELVSANKKSDGSLELTEKIIYTSTVKRNNVYDIYIYKDYQHTMLLETKTNLTEEALKEKPISVNDYKEKAATITYQFNLGPSNYYFYSSTITN